MSTDSRKKIDDENALYEILWLALAFIPENGYRSEFCKIYDILDAAINLWIPYRNNAEIVKQYKSFIELTLASAIQIADKYWNIKDPALALLERHMIDRNLNLKDFIIL